MKVFRYSERDRVTVRDSSDQRIDTWTFEIRGRTGERVVHEKRPTRYGDAPRPHDPVDRGLCYGLILGLSRRFRVVYDGATVRVPQTVPEPVENELLKAGAEEIHE